MLIYNCLLVFCVVYCYQATLGMDFISFANGLLIAPVFLQTFLYATEEVRIVYFFRTPFIYFQSHKIFLLFHIAEVVS